MTEVIDDGDDWRIKIKDSDKIFAKKVATEKKPNVKVDVSVELKTTNGNKSVDVSVANVYYPKNKYSREDIEAKLDEIVAKAVDPSCPLCQRFKTALSVEERKTILDDLMLPKPDMFTPRTIGTPVIDAISSMLGDTLQTFELFFPDTDKKIEKK